MDDRRDPLRDWALLILRLAVGAAFIVHGYPKLFPSGPGGFAGFVGSLGFPVPVLFAWGVALLEFIGGMAMIVGFLVRPLGVLYVIEMVVTTVRVKMTRGVGFIEMQGTGWEIDVVLLAVALALALTGAGAFSVDAALSRRRSVRA